MAPSAVPNTLPIWEIHSPILSALREGNRLALVAPTGSGKTTQVPQMLLDAGLAGAKRIVVLQPRRVAARSVAARVAWERKTALGGEIGYQVRFDDVTSLGTRICFVTEGILLRWLQDDPNLSDIAILIFDEFHERNLLSDVALALAKRQQQTTRPDLKIVVMSATLEAEPVARYLSSTAAARQDPPSPCPILRSEGQSFGVETAYLPFKDERPLPEQAAAAVERILRDGEPGDILVFMPGMAEINATLNALRSIRAGERLTLIPLHGDLAPEEQDRAFAPSPFRKIVAATNVAETSITIDGIRHVVDSGVARVARYDPERGIATLFLEEISRASADQRKGRAGRTAPGTCRRLWTESGHLNRPERNTPEIQRADLAEVVLLLHSLGIQRAADFDWLDRPDPLSVQRAEDLLRLLGALRSASPNPAAPSQNQPSRARAIGPAHSDLTPIGKQMLSLPMHPRFSRMLVEAARLRCVPEAALCAALVSGRDLLVRLSREESRIAEAREQFEANVESDFFPLMRAFRFAKENHFALETCRRLGIQTQVARQIDQTWEQILDIARRQRWLSPDSSPAPVTGLLHASQETDRSLDNPDSASALLRCIMTGFIDQLAVRKDQGTLDCLLTGGRAGALMRESAVHKAPLLVIGAIKEIRAPSGKELTLLGLASAVKLEWITKTFPELLSADLEHQFDRTHKRVACLRVLRFLDLILQREHIKELDPAESGRCLADAARNGWFELPLFNHEVKQWMARAALISAAAPELDIPPFGEPEIRAALARAFFGKTLAKEAQATPLLPAFKEYLSKDAAAWLDDLAPTTLLWPDERRLKLVYPFPDPAAPALPTAKDWPALAPEIQIRLQECFSLKEHPKICEGRVPVKLCLCGPDGKRIDATQDWPSFKTLQYPKLRPSLQKKYPGVAWI